MDIAVIQLGVKNMTKSLISHVMSAIWFHYTTNYRDLKVRFILDHDMSRNLTQICLMHRNRPLIDLLSFSCIAILMNKDSMLHHAQKYFTKVIPDTFSTIEIDRHAMVVWMPLVNVSTRFGASTEDGTLPSLHMELSYPRFSRLHVI